MGLAMFIINTIVGVTGAIGNFMVVLAVFITPNLQRISNYFISSLAVADFMVNSCVQLLFAVKLWDAMMYGHCNPPVELAYTVFVNIFCMISLLTLCAISVERCVAIVKPLSYKSIITKGKLIMMVAVVWVSSLVYSFCRAQVSRKVTSYFVGVLFTIGYGAFATSYTLIFYTVRKQAKQRSKIIADVNGTVMHAAQTREKRLAITVFMLMLVVLVAWGPFHVFIIRSPENRFGVFYNWAITSALCSSAVNPVLYCIRNEDYRKAFMRMIRAVFCCRIGCGTSVAHDERTTKKLRKDAATIPKTLDISNLTSTSSKQRRNVARGGEEFEAIGPDIGKADDIKGSKENEIKVIGDNYN